MRTTSALYQEIIAETSHYFEKKVRINGVDYSEDEIFSLSTDANVFTNGPEIGKAVAAEIDLTILKPNVAIPRMAEIIPYIRVCADVRVPPPVSMQGDILDIDDIVTEMDDDIAVLSDAAYLSRDIVYFRETTTTETSEWLQMGVFYIDTRETTKNNDGVPRLTIHGYDKMLFAEGDYPSTNANDWPHTDIAVITQIAQEMGVTIDPRTLAYITGSFPVQLPTGFSMRETLGHIACAYAGNFVMSAEGKLLFLPLMGLDQEDSTVGCYLTDENGDALLFGNEGWYILV